MTNPQLFKNDTIPETLSTVTHYTAVTSFTPSAGATMFNTPVKPTKSTYDVRETVWGHISSRVDVKHELEFQVAQESKVSDLQLPSDYAYTPEPTPVELVAQRRQQVLSTLQRANPAIVTDTTPISQDTAFDRALTGRELPLPACPTCGTRVPSTSQKTFSDRRWASLDHFMNTMECLQLESLRGDLAPGQVGHINTVHQNLRVSDIAWITRTEASEWLYARLWSACEAANQRFFGYDIQFIEPLQYSVYRAESQGFYTSHYDWSASEVGIRKLSFSVQLSDPMEYSGGDLVLYTGEGAPVTAPKTQGSITVFPSWMLHEITPVTQGVRRALVGWFQGPVHF